MTIQTAQRAAAASVRQAQAELRQEFPGWRIIYSDQGRWWAQLFPLPRDQFDRINMVDADTAAGLRAELKAATR